MFHGILLAYGIYARLINARDIRIMSPIDNEVTAVHERYGFEYVMRHNYLYREIT